MPERRITFIFLTVILLAAAGAHSQPTAAFSAPPTSCLSESIFLKNTSSSSANYIWDFCQNALVQAPFFNSVATLNTSLPIGTKMAFNKGKWYGFVANREGGFSRLDFGSDPSSVPKTVDLGTFSMLNGPTEIALLQENGNWYGLVGNYYGNNLVRLSFGSDLGNVPLAENLGNLGGWSQIYGVDVVTDGSNVRAAITSNANNVISIVDFKSSITNSPTTSDVKSYTNPLIISPIKIKLQFQGSNWYGLTTSFGNDTVVKISFGTDLLNAPTFSVAASISQPAGLDLVQDGDKYIAMVCTFSGLLVRLNFGSDMSLTPALTNLSSSLGPAYGMSLLKTWPNWSLFAIDALSNKFYRLDFFDNCNDGSMNTSTAVEPVVSYNSPGDKTIELLALSPTGESVVSHRTTVLNLPAPDIRIAFNNTCVNSQTTFTGIEQTSIGISNWFWNFGDGGTSSSNPADHVYSSAQAYQSILTVTASNGCKNTATKSVQMFNSPQANFSLPLISTFCSNQDYTFTNTSMYDAGSNPTWQWSINGSSVASTQNLSASFTNTNSQTISLQASIPGCRSTFSQTISSLTPGPLVNFNVPTITCQQSNLTFANSTTGSVTGYQWSFGDGNTSTSTNGSNAYATPGTYSVTLQANNAAGCQNSATKNITIYSKPQPDFSIGLPPFSCSGSASLFTDQTPAPTDSNVTSWQWSFGDLASGTSTLRNPGYLYASDGSYNVSLTATTNFGCGGSVQKAVTISPSPAAAFTNSVACVGQPTQFTDASTGSIRSRLWTIQGNSFTAPNVQFAFVNPGSYPVTLTVTGNNNCVSQFSKTIVVPVAPTLDFSVQAPCNTNPTIFSEITSGSDAPVSQTWNFASLGTGVGATSQFTFSTPGSHSVQLRSTRQSGCAYSIIKSVNIALGPVADFVPSVDIGGPPLPVSFINTSTDATSYLWRFGDTANSTSTQVNANFTFNELGVYAVKLTASNSQGCSFTNSKPITVLVPNINVVLSDFKLVADPSGVLQPMVGITNNGNLPITNPDVLLEVESAGLIRKKISSRVLPAQTVAVPVDLQVVPRSATYICAELVVPNNTADFDRRRCVPLGANEVLFAPYPNPAQGVLNFDWVSTQAQPVSVIIFGPGGSEVLRQQFISVASGLNRLQVTTAELTNGLYYILYSDGSTTKSFCFAVANN